MSFIKPDGPGAEIIEPNPENWGNKKKPGPAQIAGWRLVGAAAIVGSKPITLFMGEGFGEAYQGAPLTTQGPEYDKPSLDLKKELMAQGNIVRFVPKIDPDTGEMSTDTASTVGKELSIVALKLPDPSK